MRTSDWLSVAASTGFGAITGFLIGGIVGTIVGAALSGAIAVGAARANIRPLVATTTIVGAAAGSLIGSSVVETICLPDSCVGLEVSAAVVLGVASLIGVGLVVALVTRSFDEYNESVVEGKQPPSVGCEQPDVESDG